MQINNSRTVQQIAVLFVFSILCIKSFPQGLIEGGKVTGSLQLDAQYYIEDSALNFLTYDTNKISHESGLNAWGDIVYRNKAFTAGIRFEAFQPPLVGYPSKLEGVGIPHRYAMYSKDNITVTLGSYYAQFGNGIALRTYQDKGLGIDNALNGIKVDYSIKNKIFITGLAGKNRYYWDLDESNIKGIDSEIYWSDFVKEDSKFFWKSGFSYVNREYPEGRFNENYPWFVDVFAVRNTFQYKNIALEAEGGYKTSDRLDFIPFSDSTEGKTLLVNASYANKGFGFSGQYKIASQFDFRTTPQGLGLERFLNFLPPIAKFYSLKEFSRYPFVTTATNEQGLQGEITYSPKRGKTILINYSKVHDFEFKDKFYESVYVEFDWKLSKKLHALAGYQYLDYDFVLQQKTTGHLFAHLYLLDLSYRIKRKVSLRGELQYLTTAEDLKDWIFGLMEITVAPHFSFAIIDEVNIGSDKDTHYVSFNTSYTKGGNKFILTAGRQSQGFQCAGGVCRLVPAYTGIGLTVLSNF